MKKHVTWGIDVAMSMARSKRPVPKHIIVCPFCEVGQPIPTDFDAIHRCQCGACFKVCGHHAVEDSMSDIAEELWEEDELHFIRSVPMEYCNVVVERDFDRLLDLKQTADPNEISRFCKYDVGSPLSLIWVKRLF